MHNLNPRPFAWIIATVAVVVAVASALASKGSLSDPKFCWGLLSTLATAIFIFSLVFAKWIWKWSLLHGWLVPFPNLNGVWEGTIVSTWIPPGETKPIGPIPAILTIKQSFTKVSCVMQTGEMKSHSFVAGFHIADDDQICRLVYSYTSDPKPTVQERSPRHYGTVVLDVEKGKPARLKGFYWSDRKTTGEIQFVFQGPKRRKRHDDALAEHPMLRTAESKL